MWEIRVARRGEEGDLLKERWEPFAISPQNTSYTMNGGRDTVYQTTDYIYFRRETKEGK